MKQILTRLALTLPVVWLVVSLVFLLIHLVPGDPILQMLGEGATPADISALRHQYGLDLPLHTQYLHYWAGVLHGDLGSSIRMHDTVAHLIAARYPYTMALTLDGAGTGAGAGASGGDSGGGAARALAGPGALRGEPVWAFGPGLGAGAGVDSDLLHRAGMAAGFRREWRWNAGHRLALPGAAVGSDGRVAGGDSTRMVRTAMLEELGQDYIRTARAKGLSEMAVVCRHALPNALVPIVTVVGLQFGALLAGAIVTETIFSWPGLGRLAVSAIANRDYALVQGCLLSIGLTYVLVNLLTEWCIGG